MNVKCEVEQRGVKCARSDEVSLTFNKSSFHTDARNIRALLQNCKYMGHDRRVISKLRARTKEKPLPCILELNGS